jgi:hypothetical protein
MKMEALSVTESQIIRSMLVKQCRPSSPFLDQLEAVQVVRRRTTGVGIFVDLLVAGNPDTKQTNGEITQFYKTLLAFPADYVGFTLFIRDGCLSLLEGYTFGDAKWPDEPMEKWLMLEVIEVAGQKTNR